MHLTNDWNGVDDRTQEVELALTSCSESIGPEGEIVNEQLTEELVKRLKLREFTCPLSSQFDDLIIASGGFRSNRKISTNVLVQACTGTDCLPSADINELIGRTNIELLFMNANFDPKNLEEPIAYYADKRLYQELIPDVQKEFSVNMKSQLAILSDSYFGNSRVEKRFFEVNQISSNINRFNKSDGTLVRYRFQASGVNTIYQRQIFNLFDALSRIGGVYSAMFTGGLLFTSAFSYRLMMSSLIGKLFHFRPKFASEVKIPKKRQS